jgi:hypothetical protein
MSTWGRGDDLKIKGASSHCEDRKGGQVVLPAFLEAASETHSHSLKQWLLSEQQGVILPGRSWMLWREGLTCANCPRHLKAQEFPIWKTLNPLRPGRRREESLLPLPFSHRTLQLPV